MVVSEHDNSECEQEPMSREREPPEHEREPPECEQEPPECDHELALRDRERQEPMWRCLIVWSPQLLSMNFEICSLNSCI